MLIITGCVLLVPTVTCPKFTLKGFGVNCPYPVVLLGATPVPESETVVGEFIALDSNHRLHVTVPVVLGVKITVKDVL